jgi:hypothetical protein
MRVAEIYFDPGALRQCFMPAVLFALVKGYCFAQSAPEPFETFPYRFSHRGRIVFFK